MIRGGKRQPNGTACMCMAWLPHAAGSGSHWGSTCSGPRAACACHMLPSMKAAALALRFTPSHLGQVPRQRASPRAAARSIRIIIPWGWRAFTGGLTRVMTATPSGSTLSWAVGPLAMLVEGEGDIKGACQDDTDPTSAPKALAAAKRD